MCMDTHRKFFLFAVTKYQKELVKVLVHAKHRHWLNSVGRQEVQDVRQGARMAVDAVVESSNSRVLHIATFEEIAQFHVRSFFQ